MKNPKNNLPNGLCNAFRQQHFNHLIKNIESVDTLQIFKLPENFKFPKNFIGSLNLTSNFEDSNFDNLVEHNPKIILLG